MVVTPEILAFLKTRLCVLNHSKRIRWELHWRGFRFVGDAWHYSVYARDYHMSGPVSAGTVDAWLCTCEVRALALIAIGWQATEENIVPTEILRIEDSSTYIAALVAFETEAARCEPAKS